jgi:hypothetical protein
MSDMTEAIKRHQATYIWELYQQHIPVSLGHIHEKTVSLNDAEEELEEG